MGVRIPILDVLCADKAGATLALQAAGCRVEPALQLSVEHPMIGTVHRMFGVMNNLAAGEDTERLSVGQLAAARGYVETIGMMADSEVIEAGQRLGERFLRALDDPDNERVATRLRQGAIKFMPANKTLVKRVRKVMGLRGAHLPWSFQALNLELSMKVQDACSNYGFVVFYSESATFADLEVDIGRVFTTPFGVSGFGTWQEPISSDILDEDVGLILEANWLGQP